MLRKSLFCVAMLICFSTLLSSAAWADEPLSLDAVRQVLTQKVNWSFEDKTLSDVVDSWSKDLKIPIILNTNAIMDAGLMPDSNLSFKLPGVTAKAGMRAILKELGLTIFWDGEVLHVTTPDVADCNLTTVIYDVSTLPAFRRTNGKTVPNYEQLIEILEKTIKPTAWDRVGGAGSILEYDAGDVQLLVISQTWDTHEEISDLLNRLRKIHRAPLSKEAIADLPPVPEAKPIPICGGLLMYGGGPAASAPRQPEGTRGAAVPAGTPGPGVAPAGAPGAGAPAPAPAAGPGFGAPPGYGPVLPPGYGMPGGVPPGYGPGRFAPPNAAPAGAAGAAAPAPASGGQP